MGAPKEPFYDERISPLMSQIIALCKEAKINMAAQFSLGYDDENEAPLWCTTVLHNVDPDDEEGVQRMKELRAKMYPPRADFAAFMITGGSK